MRNCFEFLQKVFLVLMYSFSCVLWAIFGPFRSCPSSDNPLSSSSQKRKCLKNSSPNHHMINSKQFLSREHQISLVAFASHAFSSSLSRGLNWA